MFIIYCITLSLSFLHTATSIPVVEIITIGLAQPGEQYMLNCTVSVIDRFIVSPVITWTKRSASNTISVSPVNMVVSDTMMSLILNFSSLNTSDAGQYTCEVSLNVSQIGMITNNSDFVNLPLESKSFFKAIDMLHCCVHCTILSFCKHTTMIQSLNDINLRLHVQCNSHNVVTLS